MGYPVKKIKKYTYKDYLSWTDDERCELIDGVVYDMSPAPSRRHQEISVELTTIFNIFLKNKSCKVYAAPFDVRLAERNEKEDEITTVVQPDIAVICDKNKLDDKGCVGAPDLLIEIISQSTASKDYIIKSKLYEKHKVKEFWIIQPVDEIVMVYKLLKNNKYAKPDIYSKEDKVKVGIFSGELIIDLKEVFNK